MKEKIGFIGQGYIGKNYADDFENRGYSVVRYALEEPYNKNKEKIKDCDIVFIAVPTPTTPRGFDCSIIRDALGLVGNGKTAIIKSTILPGTTEQLQQENGHITVLCSPEFLSEVTAAHDAKHPFANIIGIPFGNEQHRARAQRVLDILPSAPFSQICSSTEAEIIKYAHNISAYIQIITFNMIYDLAHTLGYDWQNIGKAIHADPLISSRYANPVHKSGRGAGSSCFIKDFAAFRQLYEKVTRDPLGTAVLKSNEEKNKQLLIRSKKDLDLLKRVYGTIENVEKNAAFNNDTKS